MAMWVARHIAITYGFSTPTVPSCTTNPTLSAAQAALLAVRRGASRVVHVSRRPMKARPYDLPMEWMNPNANRGFDNTWKGKGKGDATFRLFEFYATPKSERAAWVKNARGGATVPAAYLDELESTAEAGRLERWVDEIATAEVCEDGEPNAGAIRLTFHRGGSEARAIVADRVVLATGSTLDIGRVPLLRSVADRFDLPVVGTLPDLDEDLQWGDESFSVAGAFALLEVGPDAGNLTGCRRSAKICADACGVFDSFTETGKTFANKYSALFGSDSDSDESESESESESDTTNSEESDPCGCALSSDSSDSSRAEDNSEKSHSGKRNSEESDPCAQGCALSSEEIYCRRCAHGWDLPQYQ